MALLLSLFASLAFAQTGSPAVDKALTTELKNTKFTARLATGYHFNDQAPNIVIVDEHRVQPTRLEKQVAVFDLPAKEFKNAHASVYVCDDANTFCEPRRIALKGDLAKEKKAQSPNKSKIKISRHGFIEDNFEAALVKAKKEKKLLLVDFSARWCPGCVRLENEVFLTPFFKKASAKFVKVKLDVDRFENQELDKKYDIYAIPTLLVLNERQEEISRMVDYQSNEIIKAFLKDASDAPFSFAELKVKAKAGDQPSMLVLGRRLYTARKYEEALPYLSEVSPTPIELPDLRVRLAAKEKETKKAEFQKIVKSAIAQEPNSTRSLVWRAELIGSLDAKDSEKKKIAQEGIVVADDLLAHPDKIAAATQGDFIGEFTGYEKLLVAIQRADLFSEGGFTEEEILAAKLKTAEVGKELKIPASLTGPSMRYLLALVDAKLFPEAEVQVRALLARDKANPELQRRLLRILNEQQKYKEAIQIGLKTLPKSYGRNEIWVVQQLAKGYAGNDQKLEAKALIRSYLERADLNWNAMNSEEKDLKDQLSKL